MKTENNGVLLLMKKLKYCMKNLNMILICCLIPQKNLFIKSVLKLFLL